MNQQDPRVPGKDERAAMRWNRYSMDYPRNNFGL